MALEQINEMRDRLAYFSHYRVLIIDSLRRDAAHGLDMVRVERNPPHFSQITGQKLPVISFASAAPSPG